MPFESLIAIYGYPAVFMGAILEGETVLLIAAALINRDLMSFQGAVIAAGLGAFAGDQFFYHLGRLHGQGALSHRPRWRLRISRASALLERRPRTVMLGYRFLYGLRAVIPFLLGAGKTRPWPFAFLSAISAGVWSVSITAAGYFGGRILSEWIQAGLAVQKWILLAAGAAVVVVLIGRGLRTPRRRRATVASDSRMDREAS